MLKIALEAWYREDSQLQVGVRDEHDTKRHAKEKSAVGGEPVISHCCVSYIKVDPMPEPY